MPVPLGIAAVILALWAVPESSDPQNRPFDATAQILGAVALGSLALAAIESHGAGGNAILAVISLVVAVAASGLFIMVERKIGASALVLRSRCFRIPVFAVSLPPPRA